MLRQIKGRVLLDTAGVQSTFLTTLNKKSHANQHLFYDFDPVLNQKRQYSGELKLVLC